MRRLALPALTFCGLAILSACGGGGSAFSTGTNNNASIDSIGFKNGSGQTNDFFVTPGGTAPLRIDAFGQKGSGPGAISVPDALFTWAARYVDPKTDKANVANYTTGTAPSTFKTCPALPLTTPAVPILQSGIAGTSLFYNGAYSSLPASQAATTVFVGPVAGVTPPYCLVVVATHLGDGVQGSKTIVVSASP